jgi:hypothetical protein
VAGGTSERPLAGAGLLGHKGGSGMSLLSCRIVCYFISNMALPNIFLPKTPSSFYGPS